MRNHSRLGAVVLLLVGLAVPAQAVPASARAAPARSELAPVEPAAREVRLPTGDLVKVSAARGDDGGGGPLVTDIQAAARKGGQPAFLTTERGENVYVVPEDALPGLTDMEPYNVTRLARGGQAPRGRVKVPAGATLDLRVRAVDRFGRPARGIVGVLDVDDGGVVEYRFLPGDSAKPCTEQGSSCIRLPPGTYSVMGFVYTMPIWRGSTDRGTELHRSLVGDPELTLTQDGEFVLDARKATEVKVVTPDHQTKANRGSLSHVMWRRAPASGPDFSQGFLISGQQMQERVFLQPTRRVRTGTFEAYTRWRLEAPAITLGTRGVRLDPDYYRPTYFSDVSAEFPRLDGRARLRLADAGAGRPEDLAGRDLRGKLALIRRSDELTVAQQSNAAAKAGARLVAVYNDRPGLDTDTAYGSRLMVPTVHLPHEQGRRLLDLLDERPVTVDARGIIDSPYLYELVLPEKGQIRSDLRHVARSRHLARVRADYYALPGQDFVIETMRTHRRPWESVARATMTPFFKAPRSRVEYLSPDPETRWHAALTAPESPYNVQWPRPKTPYMLLDETQWKSYSPGERRHIGWLKQPVAPGVYPLFPSSRDGDVVRLVHKGFADAGGNAGDAATTPYPDGLSTDFRVYRDGRLITQTHDAPYGSITVPPEEAVYRIEHEVGNDAVWARLSTRTRAVWTFRSRRSAEPVVLPLPLIGVDAPVDEHNRLRGRTLTLTPHHQRGAAEIPFRAVTLAASYDEGATWHDVRVRGNHDGSYRALLRPPRRGAETVSLRTHAEDVQDNALTQEIVRAMALR
ncbi:PA domain-containing protein [Actinomadura sp. 9N215]|uniref:PA domain-containing protein n=1 Tax=Actinomadura sp. 9N215 TaxID=3375150 RepID=UPI003794D5D8